MPITAPRARFDDCIRVLAAAVAGATATSLRRLAGRRRRPGWSARLETLIGATRGAWSLMPTIGIVRWRRATEALSPLKTDGLTPRFVSDEQDGRAIKGAWLEPAGADGPVLLYFHGGGFVFGSLRSHGVLIGALARAARARTFAPEYRLGPEHPAPAAHDDAVAAYHYLLRQGIPPGRIVLPAIRRGGQWC